MALAGVAAGATKGDSTDGRVQPFEAWDESRNAVSRVLRQSLPSQFTRQPRRSIPAALRRQFDINPTDRAHNLRIP